MRRVYQTEEGNQDLGNLEGILGRMKPNIAGEGPNISLHLPENLPKIPQVLRPSLNLGPYRALRGFLIGCFAEGSSLISEAATSKYSVFGILIVF